ncbi:nucleoside-diphosphate kinase [Enterococcus casseliflavus]|uniref:nucleoside-diphosphate kinase n=1 Tax=Enterococcus casseliflavus TaxID=37734 RepID=UPI00163D4949|nr:nucleoside-diphosphate kinase [Enterococcus casseliflavus]
MEETLIILKPDCIERNLTEVCIKRLLKIGNIKKMKTCEVKSKQILEHYSENLKVVDQDIKNRVLDYFVNKTVIVIVLDGENIIKNVRNEIGTSDPSESPLGTIRRDYCNDSYKIAEIEQRSCRNIIHASDSVHSYEKEFRVWFKE